MRHMKINPANGLRSLRQFLCVAAIAASEIQDPHAPKIQSLIYFLHALTNSVRAIGSGTSKLDRVYSRGVFKMPAPD